MLFSILNQLFKLISNNFVEILFYSDRKTLEQVFLFDKIIIFVEI